MRKGIKDVEAQVERLGRLSGLKLRLDGASGGGYYINLLLENGGIDHITYYKGSKTEIYKTALAMVQLLIEMERANTLQSVRPSSFEVKPNCLVSLCNVCGESYQHDKSDTDGICSDKCYEVVRPFREKSQRDKEALKMQLTGMRP